MKIVVSMFTAGSQYNAEEYFDSDYKENLKPENEEESEKKEEPKGIPQLPGPSEVEDEDVIDAEYTETEIDQETDEEPEEDITDEILGDAKNRTIWMAMIMKTRRMKYELKKRMKSFVSRANVLT